MPQVRAFPTIPTKILLPIDFSPSSQAALEMAADLAHHFHAELYLVNVIPFFPATTLPDFIPEQSFLQEAKDQVESHFSKCHSILTSRGIHSTSSIEVGNNVAGNIMAVIEREQINMVVLSTHGISGWHPLLFGSVAEKLVKLVQCPLLLLRTTKEEIIEKMPSERTSGWW